MPRKKKNKYQEIYNRYCLAGVIILGVFIISYLGFTFINDTNEKRYQQSYLVKSKLVKDSYNIEGNLSNIKKLVKNKNIRKKTKKNESNSIYIF